MLLQETVILKNKDVETHIQEILFLCIRKKIP